ncbi:MFS transporter [Paraburkholderia caballeronis]|uniref:D-galactonate transporter n=1 Tax=Paraburkholderia caballeronis TaxID=416943 RepID=A0A1H7P1A2_9BURK|nr:MFS transporter [Paraburkholderia caballeronis]PXW25442.1 D-galactonate transporter [Paraburkholderia caballeronis]PXX01049.1 D-galactonate transporter [Paraburkholderia caballeronis]RAJ99598.1 D-galactonate transporter [Paraburkholderia caballeronis]SEE37223.1 D-galactonate transporter [Paraburkholderia caballeronis]SEL29244.1 D-galactonate transporter [Paraburkholderia caballeronis]
MSATSYGKPAGYAPPDDIDDASATAALYRKLTRRILPFLFLAFVVAYVDRVNVSFAKLQMLADLHLSETVYGIGAGIFFLGYFIFEVPSNLILDRVGARLWIARIMVTWAVVSAATMFARDATSFYVLRFFLGVAEAGFFPGIVLYLSNWFPSARRSQIIALFMTAIPVSGAIGGPLSGWVMTRFVNVGGMAGWKWLFLIEGLGSLVVGIAAFFLLYDRIDSVKWLSADEKARLTADLRRDAATRVPHSVRGAFASGRVWLLGLTYFCIAMGNYGLAFWTPTIIKASGVASVSNIGWLSAVPALISAVAMVLIARHADRHDERRRHVATCCVIGALGLLASVLSASNATLSLIALVLAAIGINSIAPVFWGIPTALMGGAGAAAAIAVINCTGNLAGFVSPFVVGWLSDQSGGKLLPGMIAIAVALFIGALLVLVMPARRSSHSLEKTS